MFSIFQFKKCKHTLPNRSYFLCLRHRLRRRSRRRRQFIRFHLIYFSFSSWFKRAWNTGSKSRNRDLVIIKKNAVIRSDYTVRSSLFTTQNWLLTVLACFVKPSQAMRSRGRETERDRRKERAGNSWNGEMIVVHGTGSNHTHWHVVDCVVSLYEM